MRLLIFILLFSTAANGQIIRANSFYRATASAASCSYLLDDYSGAKFAYSLRKLSTSYSGPLIRVRRSSDNAEQDIGAAICNELDTAALKTFVGTGGSDDGFIVYMYDQSGNAIDAYQGTYAAQAFIMDDGVVLRTSGKVTMVFSGNDTYALTVSITTNSVYVFGVASKFSFDGNTYARFLSFANASNDFNSTGTWLPISFSEVPDIQTYRHPGPSGAAIAPYTYGQRYLIYSFLDASNIGMALDAGTANTVMTSGASLAITKAQIGSTAFFDPGSYLAGHVQELVVWNTDVSASRTGIETNINNYWNVF